MKYIFFIVLSTVTTLSLSGKTYICAYVYCDQKGEESFFPNANTPYKSSSKQFQKIYWECATTMFATSKRVNTDVEHILFTNKKNIPNPYKQLLENLNIVIKTVPFSFIPPQGWFYKFRNSLYTIDCLKYLASFCNEQDHVILLDADTIWLKNAQEIIQSIDTNDLLFYAIDYTVDQENNGITRRDYIKLLQELTSMAPETIPLHAGGEFVATNGKTLKKIMPFFESLWRIMIQRFADKKVPLFTTEEHYMSYLFHFLGYRKAYGNNFIKRVWTNEEIYRNVSGDELSYTILHLPAEKQRGFKTLFTLFQATPQNFWGIPEETHFPSLCEKIFNLKKADTI
jgi:hypothetical protein